jgi:hypothetical protein
MDVLAAPLTAYTVMRGKMGGPAAIAAIKDIRIL